MTGQTEDYLVVVDPLSRKLKIPRSAVYDTRAFHRATPPSLCMLFMSGRCRQGLQCHQAHADTDVVTRLRAEALKIPSCCAAHGDMSVGKDLESTKVTIVLAEDRSITLKAEYFAATAGLAQLLHQGQITNGCHMVYPATLCRLHAYDRCRYAEDCRFLHLCRGVVAENPYIIPRELQATPTLYRRNTPPSYYTSLQVQSQQLQHQPWASEALLRHHDNLESSWSTAEQSPPDTPTHHGMPSSSSANNNSFRSESGNGCYAHAPYSPKLIPWNLEEEWVC